MAYTFRFLKPEDRTRIEREVKERRNPPAVAAPDEAILRAWEADLAAHIAALELTTGDELEQHYKAIRTLEKALNSVAKKTGP